MKNGAYRTGREFYSFLSITFYSIFTLHRPSKHHVDGVYAPTGIPTYLSKSAAPLEIQAFFSSSLIAQARPKTPAELIPTPRSNPL